MQYIFVNGRPVANKNISFHLNRIFRLIMPESYFPAFACYVEVDPTQVDVNIHPTKREVKLTNETHVCSVLRNITEQLLMTQSPMQQAGSTTTVKIPQTNRYIAGHYAKEKSFDISTRKENLEDSNENVSKNDYAYPQSPQSADLMFNTEELFKQSDDSLKSKLSDSIYIGSFSKKYLLFEYQSSLLVIDQHAAAERVTFEMLTKQVQKNEIEVQKLLAPIVLKCSPQELLIWEETKEYLEQCGFENNQFDEESTAIHSYPTLLKDTEKSVREILAGSEIEKCDFSTVARRACRSSIMAGDKLDKTQVEYLKSQLLDCADPLTCPHGRPTIIEMTEDFLDKQFLRI